MEVARQQTGFFTQPSKRFNPTKLPKVAFYTISTFLWNNPRKSKGTLPGLEINEKSDLTFFEGVQKTPTRCVGGWTRALLCLGTPFYSHSTGVLTKLHGRVAFGALCVWLRKLAVPRLWLRANSWEVSQEGLSGGLPA